MDSLSYISNHLIDIVVLAVGALYGYGIWKDRRKVATLNDDTRWEAALKLRDTTIDDLQKRIVGMETQIRDLTDRNNVLTTTVNGRDLLVEVVAEQKKIADSLTKFEVLLSTDGLLSKFMENDMKILGGIQQIKDSLSVSHA